MPTTPRGQTTQPSTRTGSHEHRQHVETTRQNRSSNTGNSNSDVVTAEFAGLNLGGRQDTPGGRRRRRRRRSSKRRKPRKSKKKRRRRRKKRTKKKRRRRR